MRVSAWNTQDSKSLGLAALECHLSFLVLCSDDECGRRSPLMGNSGRGCRQGCGSGSRHAGFQPACGIESAGASRQAMRPYLRDGTTHSNARPILDIQEKTRRLVAQLGRPNRATRLGEASVDAWGDRCRRAVSSSASGTKKKKSHTYRKKEPLGREGESSKSSSLCVKKGANGLWESPRSACERRRRRQRLRMELLTGCVDRDLESTFARGNVLFFFLLHRRPAVYILCGWVSSGRGGPGKGRLYLGVSAREINSGLWIIMAKTGSLGGCWSGEVSGVTWRGKSRRRDKTMSRQDVGRVP